MYVCCLVWVLCVCCLFPRFSCVCVGYGCVASGFCFRGCLDSRFPGVRFVGFVYLLDFGICLILEVCGLAEPAVLCFWCLGYGFVRLLGLAWHRFLCFSGLRCLSVLMFELFGGCHCRIVVLGVLSFDLAGISLG